MSLHRYGPQEDASGTAIGVWYQARGDLNQLVVLSHMGAVIHDRGLILDSGFWFRLKMRMRIRMRMR